MADTHALLADVWFVLLGLVRALYVILDGFDLGIGILLGTLSIARAAP